MPKGRPFPRPAIQDPILTSANQYPAAYESLNMSPNRRCCLPDHTLTLAATPVLQTLTPSPSMPAAAQTVTPGSQVPQKRAITTSQPYYTYCTLWLTLSFETLQ